MKRIRFRSFYAGMSVALLLIVLAGFSRTLYLRPVFDVPDVPVYLLLHGVVLTAWFIGVVVQTTLVAAQRVGLHRRLGWIGFGLATAAIAFSLAATVMMLFSALAANPAGPLGGVVRIFWANLAALLSCAVFLSVAAARRRQPDVHKRLMLLAAIALVQPAMARIRQQWFPDMDGPLFAIVWLSLLVGAMAVHDVYERRSIHAATLIGGGFFLGSRLLAQYVVAPSGFGLAAIRAFIE